MILNGSTLRITLISTAVQSHYACLCHIIASTRLALSGFLLLALREVGLTFRQFGHQLGGLYVVPCVHERMVLPDHCTSTHDCIGRTLCVHKLRVHTGMCDFLSVCV